MKLPLMMMFLVSLPFLGCKNRVKEAEIQKAKTELQILKSALQTFKITSGFYPSTDQGFDVLVTKPSKGQIPKRWEQIMQEIPKDPWGRAYKYKLKKDSVRIWSKGPDAKDSQDDITKEF